MSFCPNCGHETKENAKFCDRCGKNLNENEPSKKPKKKRGMIIIVILLLLLLLFFGFYFLMKPKEDHSKEHQESISSVSSVQSSSSTKEKESTTPSTTEVTESTTEEKETQVTGEEIGSNVRNLLAASILYVKENPPGSLWNGNDYAYKAKGTKEAKPEYFNEGGSYGYVFENKQVVGAGGSPMFVPSEDGQKMYFYTTGGVPTVDDDGNAYMEPKNPEDKVSVDELATFINTQGKTEEYRNLVQRMTMNG